MIKKSSKKGFSLVELLVVIAIIAILSVVAYTAVGGNTIKARDARRKQDMSTIQQALEVYFVANSKYPTSLESGTVLDGKIPKNILSDIPTDPSGKHSYKYATSGTSYQIGATLENEGTPDKYSSYVVGNSDTSLLTAEDGYARYLSGTTLGRCGGAGNPYKLGTGSIAHAEGDYNESAKTSCIPYDPNDPLIN